MRRLGSGVVFLFVPVSVPGDGADADVFSLSSRVFFSGERSGTKVWWLVRVVALLVVFESDMECCRSEGDEDRG